MTPNRESARVREEVARVCARTYYGRRVDDEFVFGVATGGYVFNEQAKAVLNRLRELNLITSEGLELIKAEEKAE